jgi:tRNA G26 N,N-dimethylase Trm1
LFCAALDALHLRILLCLVIVQIARHSYRQRPLTLLHQLRFRQLSKSLAEEENADQLLSQIGRSLMSVAKMPDAIEQGLEEEA